MGNFRIAGFLAASLLAGAFLCVAAPAALAKEQAVSQFVIDQLFKSDAERSGGSMPLGGTTQPPLFLDVVAPAGISSGLFEMLSGVNYVSQRREVGFLVRGDLSCFDRHGAPPTVLRAVGVNPSGFPAVDVRLVNNLVYFSQGKFLTLNSIGSTGTPTAACFWDHVDPVSGTSSFTLFGTAPPEDENAGPDPDRVFVDRFEGGPSFRPLAIEFIDVPDRAMLGDVLTYRIRLSNVGSSTLVGVGFQELFVGNTREALAVLRTVDDSISCQAFAGSSCGALPKEIESPLFPGQFMQLPYLRADYPDSLTLTAGGSVEFTVSRRVIAGRDENNQPIDAADVLGELVPLTAVVVALDGSDSMPAHAVAERNIQIVARGALSVSPAFSTPVVSETSAQTITVQLLDDQGNPLALADQSVLAEVISGEATLVGQNPVQTNAAGQASFQVLSTRADTAIVEFTASGLLDPIGNPSVSQATLDFQPANAVALAFDSTLPSSFIQGQTIDELVVRAVDNWGNTALNLGTASVQIFLYQNDEVVGGSLASNDLQNGEVVFTGFALPGDVVGEDFSFAAIRGFSGINGFSSEFSIGSAVAITLDGLGDNDVFGGNTLAVGFPSDSVTAANVPSVPAAWQGLPVSALAAAVADEASKILFLDTFFELRVSQGGVPILIDAASLGGLLELDWSLFHVDHDGELALLVTIDDGFVELNYERDQGNSAATRIDVTWIGTDRFEAGGLALTDPAETDFKAEFYVAYSDSGGPAWAKSGPDGSAPAATRFISAGTQIVRPFVLGTAYGTASSGDVSLNFPGGMDAQLSHNGGAPAAYEVGTPISAPGSYQLLVTNTSNPGFRDGSSNRLAFSIK